MAEFLPAYKRTIQQEGGYADIPGDNGGETYRGIARNFWKQWDGWPDVDSHKPLTHGQIINDDNLESKVRLFYRFNFWNRIKGDYITSQRIAEFLYDWNVNSGKHAITAAQEAVNVTADGVLGMGTLKAINSADEDTLFASLLQARRDFYNQIVASNPSQKQFLESWLRRVDSFA